MKVRCIGVQESELLDYLNHNWRGFDTKDYELLTALHLVRFHTKLFGKPFMIGFPIKGEANKKIGTEYSKENIERALKAYLEEDTPIDIFISAKEDLKETSPIGKGKGQAFQLKRIREGFEKDRTNAILKFLKEEIPKKYSPVQAVLLLVIGESGDDGKIHEFGINISQIKREFSPKKYPFDSVMFIAKTPEDRLIFGEIWPNFGATSLPFENFEFLK